MSKLILLVALCASASAQSAGDAAAGVLSAFDRHPLVAISEAHRVPQPVEFALSVVRSPRFPEKANDIVIEFGNARYQPVLDRYISGKRVDPRELRRVWADTTAVNGIWDAPMYRQFLEGVRERNRALGSRKLRVVACDPPIDWNRVQTLADAAPFLDRDRFCAGAIEREVLSKGRRALVIMGDAHLYRRRITGEPATNVVTSIESRRPGAVFVIATHIGQFRDSAQIETLLQSHTAPSLSALPATSLGALAAVPPRPPTRTRVGGGVTKSETVSIATPPRLDEVADALLHLGPKTLFTRSVPAPDAFRPEDLAELERRHQLLFGTPLDRKALFQ